MTRQSDVRKNKLPRGEPVCVCEVSVEFERRQVATSVILAEAKTPGEEEKGER